MLIGKTKITTDSEVQRMDTTAVVQIWTLETPSESENTKALFRPDCDAVLSNVSLTILRSNLADFSTKLGEVLKDIRPGGDFRLTEIEVQVEISAEGGVALVGTAKVGGKGAVTLRFANK